MSDWALPKGAATFIQWKGTQVCMDFFCPLCEGSSHYDADFAYFIRCSECKEVFELSTEVKVRHLSDGEKPTIDPAKDDSQIETVIFNGEEISYSEFLEKM